jgi:UDP-glucose:glycoprotein glucosyltransferase
VSKGTPPNGLQLTLERSKSIATLESTSAAELQPNGDVTFSSQAVTQNEHTDTLVMKTVGYWQLRANPGVWNLRIASESRGAEIYHMVEGKVDRRGGITLSKGVSSSDTTSKTLVMKDFANSGRLLLVKRREGYEEASLFRDDVDLTSTQLSGKHDTVHVFSLATGHAYERLLKIMMLSVTKRTSSPVKFWLFENVSDSASLLPSVNNWLAFFIALTLVFHSKQFLSPSFKASAKFMAKKIGCEVEFVTYKWPEWLRGQSEKQRIIWGYKILFLDVLFPLDVKKIIYVDADQVIRGDLTELWNLDLDGAPYGYTPMCSSRKETLGYAFWTTGFWQSHLRGKPYHISALYVVDLKRFRRELVGDKLRSIYQNLSADPNSLANLDQDLPNYAQHDVRIFSLPQKWLWCESWCSDETKAEAMTIDLCNNPEHKEPKISMAKRIISGDLFEESWEELDAEVDSYNRAYLEAFAA